MIPISYYVNKRILFQLVNKSLVFSLIAIKQKILASIALYRPWHDARAIARARAVTRANQEKRGLRGR